MVDGKKLVTLYDKDLTEGVNLLIGDWMGFCLLSPCVNWINKICFVFFFFHITVVSEIWGSQCVRLKVTVKSDNCGENADCSGKGICYSNSSMVSATFLFVR